MPEPVTFFTPAQPVPSATVPVGPRLSAEPKLDGWRCIVIKNDKRVRLFTRNGRDLTHRLPRMHECFHDLSIKRLMLDCELVAVTDDGHIDFYGIQDAMKNHPERLHLFAFDIMHHGTTNLAPQPLHRRQLRLDSFIQRNQFTFLHGVERFNDGSALLKLCALHDIEGVVVKHLDKPYVSGRCAHWTKVKTEAWKQANNDRWKHFRRID